MHALPRKNWNERYFELDLANAVLAYYSDAAFAKQAGVLKLVPTLTYMRPYQQDPASGDNKAEDGRTFELVGTADEEDVLRDCAFVARAPTDGEFCEWIRSIEFCISRINDSTAVVVTTPEEEEEEEEEEKEEKEEEEEEEEEEEAQPSAEDRRTYFPGFMRGQARVAVEARPAPTPTPPRRLGGGGGRRAQPREPSPEVDVALSAVDFVPLEVLGQGAFGDVVLVRRRGKGANASSLYAMKVLVKQRVLESGMEHKAHSERDFLIRMRHPFLVRLRFSFQTRTKLYLVCDYYSGGSLDAALRAEGRLTVEAARFLCAELALGLAELHRHKILHRDLKAGNVLLDAEGHACLADFGLATLVGPARSNRQARSFAGTLEYMAPEMLTKKHVGDPLGTPLDWWALGVLLYEMTHGATPFHADSARTVFLAILRDEPHVDRTKVGNVDPALDQVLARLLDKAPRKRLKHLKHLKGTTFFMPIDFARLEARDFGAPPFRPRPRRSRDTPSVCARNAIDRCLAENDDLSNKDSLSNPFRGFEFRSISQVSDSSRAGAGEDIRQMAREINRLTADNNPSTVVREDETESHMMPHNTKSIKPKPPVPPTPSTAPGQGPPAPSSSAAKKPPPPPPKSDKKPPPPPPPPPPREKGTFPPVIDMNEL